MAIEIKSLDHLVLTARDIEASLTWYESVLGMAREAFIADDGSTRFALRFGTQKINLHASRAEFAPHAKTPTPGSADLCLLIVGSLEDAAAHLAQSGVPVEVGPVIRMGAMGTIRSLYVRDPDENLIEISQSI